MKDQPPSKPARNDELGDLFAESDLPSKSLEELVNEGKISPAQFKSYLLLMQVGIGFSTSPEDAAYIARKIEELNAAKKPDE